MLIATGTSQSSIHDAAHDACNNRSCRFGAIARTPETAAAELTETCPLARTAQPQPGQLGDATKQPARPLRGQPARPQPPREGFGCSHPNPEDPAQEKIHSATPKTTPAGCSARRSEASPAGPSRRPQAEH